MAVQFSMRVVPYLISLTKIVRKLHLEYYLKLETRANKTYKAISNLVLSVKKLLLKYYTIAI